MLLIDGSAGQALLHHQFSGQSAGERLGGIGAMVENGLGADWQKGVDPGIGPHMD
jgi:hypothetical protein